MHTLVMISASIFIFTFLLLKKKFRELLILFIPTVLLLGVRLMPVFNQNLEHTWINPGFNVTRPLTVISFVKYWFVNWGVGVFTIPMGLYLAKKKQKLLFVGIVLLLIIGNIFQLGFRIDHNHSIFNFVFIFANMFSAYFVYRVWQGGIARKLASIVIVFLLTISGLINLMAVKNDFQFNVSDAPKDMLIAWVRDNTAPDSVFLAPSEQFDPVTLAGRKNYLGNNYYLEVMGYDYLDRRKALKGYFEVGNNAVLEQIKQSGIDYVLIPIVPQADFNYDVAFHFWEENVKLVYEDSQQKLYKL